MEGWGATFHLSKERKSVSKFSQPFEACHAFKGKTKISYQESFDSGCGKGESMERAKDLLVDAEDFFGAANDLFSTGRWSKVCFNCQQAVELALKAILNYLGLERRGHGLKFFTQ